MQKHNVKNVHSFYYYHQFDIAEQYVRPQLVLQKNTDQIKHIKHKTHAPKQE